MTLRRFKKVKRIDFTRVYNLAQTTFFGVLNITGQMPSISAKSKTSNIAATTNSNGFLPSIGLSCEANPIIPKTTSNSYLTGNNIALALNRIIPRADITGFIKGHSILSESGQISATTDSNGYMPISDSTVFLPDNPIKFSQTNLFYVKMPPIKVEKINIEGLSLSFDTKSGGVNFDIITTNIKVDIK